MISKGRIQTSILLPGRDDWLMIPVCTSFFTGFESFYWFLLVFPDNSEHISQYNTSTCTIDLRRRMKVYERL